MCLANSHLYLMVVDVEPIRGFLISIWSKILLKLLDMIKVKPAFTWSF